MATDQLAPASLAPLPSPPLIVLPNRFQTFPSASHSSHSCTRTGPKPGPSGHAATSQVGVDGGMEGISLRSTSTSPYLNVNRLELCLACADVPSLLELDII